MDKDYYKILKIANNADELEIKKAYRQLVMKFHPDRNEGNTVAETLFREVQEAYEVLSHPGKRSAYNQQRWYRQSSQERRKAASITAYDLLHKSKALNRYISTLDTFHINIQGLNNYLLQLLSAQNLKAVMNENDQVSNKLIIEELLRAANLLPLKYYQHINDQLVTLAGDDDSITALISKHLMSKRFSHYRDLYLPLVVLVTAILICMLIFLISK